MYVWLHNVKMCAADGGIHNSKFKLHFVIPFVETDTRAIITSGGQSGL